jgi:RNA polymerase sigma-70 factor (ECF subfamily)
LEASPQIFTTTHWSIVLAAGRDRSGTAREAGRTALNSLCRTYWPPVYAYIRARADGAGDPEDLTQEFFFRLLDGQYLAQVDPRKGRFRSFLFVAIQHFLSNARDHARAIKRGGRVTFLSLDELAAEARADLEPPTQETPEKIYERRWAATFLGTVLGQLRAECAVEGNDRQFDLLKTFLTGSKADSTYAELAAQLGATEGALKMRVQRLRQRYGELIRAEITRTVADPTEVEDEMRHLLRVVSG